MVCLVGGIWDVGVVCVWRKGVICVLVCDCEGFGEEIGVMYVECVVEYL